jgi:hypothetical protein
MNRQKTKPPIRYIYFRKTAIRCSSFIGLVDRVFLRRICDMKKHLLVGQFVWGHLAPAAQLTSQIETGIPSQALPAVLTQSSSANCTQVLSSLVAVGPWLNVTLNETFKNPGQLLAKTISIRPLGKTAIANSKTIRYF